MAEPFQIGVGRDPTAVLGRRTGAWCVDALLAVLLALLVLAGTGEVTEEEGLGSCSVVRTGVCVQLDDAVYTADGGGVLLAWVIPLAVSAFFAVAVQGITGATPGKWVFGLRVVDGDGRPPGMGRAALRWVLWVVDGIGCVVPLVAPITATASRGHRRVGDMAARTFVVDGDDTGRAIRLRAAPTASPATAPAPATTPTLGARPSAVAHASPQWDAARRAYVLWDPTRQAWLTYDQARQEWVTT